MQKLLQGKNSFLQIGDVLMKAKCNSVFLIAGNHFFQTTNLQFLHEWRVSHFIKKGVNVEEKEIENTYEAFLKHDHQAILAIGGGSVIDLAKAVIFKCLKHSQPVPYFIAVPTTAGSGAEATHFAVAYLQNKKMSFVHASLLPSLVILDPVLTYSLSPYLTAVSGIDVLAQAIESYWNKNATDESKIFAKDALLLWMEHFVNAVNNPDEIAREKMLLAAHFAGKAINITRTTGPHALSYYLTANFNIPHGQAVAFFLPLFFLYNQPGEGLCNLLGANNANEAVAIIRKVMKEAGLAVTLKEVGVDKELIITSLLKEVNVERFANNPEPFNESKLTQLILEHL